MAEESAGTFKGFQGFQEGTRRASFIELESQGGGQWNHYEPEGEESDDDLYSAD